MKLRNKKTGEIINLLRGELSDDCGDTIVLKPNDDHEFCYRYNSLTELNEEWEDYEEPKEDYIRVIESFIHYVEEADDSFYCDESVKKFVDKLKAWKRLKDKGFKFGGWKRDERFCGDYTIEAQDYTTCDNEDLDLLFGGEDD